jgi:hypothetical protein
MQITRLRLYAIQRRDGWSGYPDPYETGEQKTNINAETQRRRECKETSPLGLSVLSVGLLVRTRTQGC